MKIIESEILKKIFTSSKMDWWVASIPERRLYLGEDIVSFLHLDSSVLSFDEIPDYLDPIKTDFLLKNIYDPSINKIQIPLSPQRFINLNVVLYRSYISSEEWLGYMIMGQGESSDTDNCCKLSFLANMSYEMRTPLNSIIGFSKLLAQTDDDYDRKEYLKIILENNDILNLLINNIIDLSNIENDAFKMKIEEIDLIKAMRDISQFVIKKIEGSAVRFTFEEPDLSQCRIMIDFGHFFQVINTLLSNSIKFTSKGTITLRYSVKNNSILFEVKDTGVGISKDKIPLVFNRFVRIFDDTTETCLGLEIVSRIIKQMGGEIGVESDYGKGAHFWFTLPITMNDSIVSKRVDKENLSVQYDDCSEGSSVAQKTILVAEDDRSNYKLYEVLLKNKYILHHAWNGEEAVELSKECNPDLILMDINMPVMDGYMALKRIREDGCKVPIAAVTAYALSDEEEKIIESGFDSYISKPLNSKVLFKTIDDLLNK
jgi:CheY-like chemotaxis protein